MKDFDAESDRSLTSDVRLSLSDTGVRLMIRRPRSTGSQRTRTYVPNTPGRTLRRSLGNTMEISDHSSTTSQKQRIS
jgi:hypothetical protein